MTELQYPTGKFSYPTEFTEASIEAYIGTIEKFPETLSHRVASLSENELMKAYRPGGWSVLQVVHHCADSHMNAYIRLKLALTENNPTIKPYMENLWAELPDTALTPVALSLDILKGVHFRWIILLKSLKAEDWLKTYNHPETGRLTSIREMTALYAWHCMHHYAHIELALKA